MRKPLIVYVSGAPGSGKSTLAEKISKELYIPHISSDLVHGGVRLTQGKSNDRYKSFHEVFVPLMQKMAKMNVSFVVDQVLMKDRSETDVIGKLQDIATVINIHALCSDPITRYVTREKSRKDHGVYISWQTHQRIIQAHTERLELTKYPLELASPQLVVDTDREYAPKFEEIIDFISNNYTLHLEDKI